jgi:hypothetical protein
MMNESTITKAGGMAAETSAIEATNLASQEEELLYDLLYIRRKHRRGTQKVGRESTQHVYGISESHAK